jgi:hypothetical protein
MINILHYKRQFLFHLLIVILFLNRRFFVNNIVLSSVRVHSVVLNLFDDHVDHLLLTIKQIKIVHLLFTDKDVGDEKSKVYLHTLRFVKDQIGDFE